MIPAIQQWLAEVVPVMKPAAPVLEVGSYDVNGTVREFLPEPYTGIDMRDGPGVDQVQDILNHTLPLASFNTIVCLEVLEHCPDPITAVSNMSELLAPGGQIYITAPFAWPQHEEPRDYWRFTPDGLKLLMERAGFVNIKSAFGNNRSHAYAIGEKP